MSKFTSKVFVMRTSQCFINAITELTAVSRRVNLRSMKKSWIPDLNRINSSESMLDTSLVEIIARIASHEWIKEYSHNKIANLSKAHLHNNSISDLSAL